MDGNTDIRQRLLKWTTETQTLVGLIQEFSEENERLRTTAAAAERECERLRQETTELRKEHEEMLGAFSKLMGEILRPMNEIMQKIRGGQRKSPFEREAGVGIPPEPAAVDRARSTPA